MAVPNRRRHVWLAGVPVDRDEAARLAVRVEEPTRSRLAAALRQDTVMARLDRDDEERVLRALAPDPPQELDELYGELLRRCRPGRGG